MSLSPIQDAITALQEGRFVIIVDDENRENEGDLVLAADCISEEKMAFIIRHTGGVVCLPMSNAIADQLDLPPMVRQNTSKYGTPFTVSVEAAEGVATGISAKDRAHTVKTAVSTVAKAEDLSRPGHIFPLRSCAGGVLVRAGHTEASVDLCTLAGLRHAAVLSELMHDDGTMMRVPSLTDFAQEHNIPIISIEDLIAFRHRREVFVRREAETELETETGAWRLLVYRDTLSNQEHVALVKGDITGTEPTLVRVHSECLTGDTFGSVHCDCGEQLNLALEKIEQEGKGALLYLRQEGRGIGLINKIHAYALQNTGLDTVEANQRLGFSSDLRQYGIGAQILKDIGLGNIRLLTNNPKKITGLNGYGLHVVEQCSLEVESLTPKQRTYLRTKKEKMGHWLKHV
ncbi:bifunctional 3,4-dihydroxy-2-butanone-4-phosphate synthase/GTP cyclohydrolase II [Candidatus Peregrinibacteria bacterium CG10_big_fil_rev_8_21_14_0_10_49_10]|nr:MAG: bifunctional 3,4-dihydroxy-2-butanone-4-phosphate synthase/GTP cyclohydrolase II [Candidatus Peregrinibacteria bacterium CG10_big_fil_rev_8_21_14_0_10_49_10]